MTMRTSVQYLDAVKRKLGVSSDYALRTHLGITTASISSIRNGKSHMGEETAIKVADILGIAREEVLSAVSAERAKSPEARAVWTSMWDKFAVNFDVLRRKSGLCVSPALA